jgi:hypothetical protein
MPGNTMKRLRNYILCGGLLWAWAGAGMAEDVSPEQIKGLDEQVQDIKEDVLGISTELSQLEEKLLYPSNTQVSVFVSFDEGASFRLDAVKIKVDGQDVSSHIYTFKELEALRAGGVQRLYTGNVRAGDHTLDVSIVSKASGGNADTQVASHKFTKSVKPELIEIHLAGSGAIGFRD